MSGIVVVLALLMGPAMIIFGQLAINADEELARTGTQTTGIVIQFDEGIEASDRDIQVEFMALDGSYHTTWTQVEHDQHPAVGDEVSVIYREGDPGHAIVLGHESDGEWFRGAGAVITGLLLLAAVVVLVFAAAGRRKRRKLAAST